MLEGNLVKLRPLRLDDAAPLWAGIGDDESTWHWVGRPPSEIKSEADLRQEIARRLSRQGCEYFATIDLATGEVIGSTAFLDIRPDDRHLEIGGTFMAPAFRGGNRNVEAKLLMLTEAFENRNAVRVTLKANAENDRSRAAIMKIGAKFEGLIRNQRLEHNGVWRTAAYYSVIEQEWPETKAHLLDLLGRDR